MYSLIGLKENLKTILLLSKSHMSGGEIRDARCLKSAYLSYLKSIQSDVTVPFSGKTEFVRGKNKANELIQFFRQRSAVDDLSQTEVIQSEVEMAEWSFKIRRMEEALDQFEKINPDFLTLFFLAVNYVFCAASTHAGGGTTSGAIGVIWANCKPQWSREDIFEFFIHETTHTLLFLDERRFRHYTAYRHLKDHGNYAYSSILTRNRPLDKVLHSLVVATEICSAREQFLGHPSDPKLHPQTSVMKRNAFKTIDSIRTLIEKRPILTERGVYWVDLCYKKLEEAS